MALTNPSAYIWKRLAANSLACQQGIFRKRACSRKTVRQYSSTTNENQPTASRDFTMQDVKNDLNRKMGIPIGYNPEANSRKDLLKYLPASQAELKPRSMQDSFSSAILPLGSNVTLQNKYVSFLGTVRLGRLLEDMDLFAAWVASNHIKNDKHPNVPFPYTIVTLLVDKIDFTNLKPSPNEDIRLSGHASWVGSSSIEVVVWLEQRKPDKWMKVTRALFVMVARNSTNSGPAFINPILPASSNEEKILSGGETRKQRRKKVQSQSLLKVVPNDEEQLIMHKLYIRSLPPNEISMARRQLPPGCKWMADAIMTNIILSHPENRNAQNTVFGGFIMRMATELSWSLGYMYSQFRPELKHISDIRFHKPIDVNSMITMHAHVVFTKKQYLQITVYVESFDSAKTSHNTTNVFHFTYEVPENLLEIIPQTYHEAMMYLDGRRHFFRAVNQSNIL